MHIAIAGNIGSGKTTLTRMLVKRYGWTPRYEPVDVNPYLEDFYKDMYRWSFNLQIYFLNKRFRDVVDISKSKDTIIQDRTIFEDARIFAPNLHAQGYMSDRDFKNYRDLFDLMMSLVGTPDLMIYIRSSIPNLISQISKRGRDFEQSIRIDYLTGLNDRYEEWIANYPGRLLIVDGDTLKFESNPEDFKAITEQIDAKLYGLFPRKGSLNPGSDADIIVYDPGDSHVIRAEDCIANVDYNPYEGFVTAGGIRQVWLRGSLAVEGGKVLDQEPKGKYMARGKCSL